MNEELMEVNLKTILETVQDQLTEDIEFTDEDGEAVAIREVRTFAEAGVLTMNKGLVVRLENGSEFQLTIVQSR